MSGICGVVRLDGQAPDGVAAMAARLERRGPEGTRLWSDGPAALGHTLLATTPEALTEAMPFVDPATGCVIVADARIDNRDDLLPALDLPPAAGDGALILAAWLRWGEDAPLRLLGDFAFAVWDPRGGRLFAARDIMATKPLAYAHIPGRLFAFASEPRAVLDAPGVPRALDEGRIADFLGDDLEGGDFESTFFEGVRRLPPAHHLTLDASGPRTARYWRPRAGPPLILPDDDAYAAAFREVLTQAVRCRLRCAGPVGATLSGGMDSNAVAALAALRLAEEGRGPLVTVSVVDDDPATCPETRAIHAAMALPGLDPHLVRLRDPGPHRDGLIRDIAALDDPFDGHMTLLRAVYREARARGVKVVLDGGAGDLVLTHGDRIPRLIRSLRWRAAWREVGAERAFWGYGGSRGRAVLAYARQAAAPGWARRLWRRLRRRDRRGLIDPDFARRADLTGRLARRDAHVPAAWLPVSDRLARVLAQPFVAAGQERYERVAAALGVEPRDPFVDRRVIEFCLRLPSDQLERDGWPKFVLRRALSGLVPDSIRWRRGKEHLGFATTEALLRSWPGSEDRLAAAMLRLRRYVRHEGDRLADLPNRDAVSVVDRWELLYLGEWLENTGRLTPDTNTWDRG